MQLKFWCYLVVIFIVVHSVFAQSVVEPVSNLPENESDQTISIGILIERTYGIGDVKAALHTIFNDSLSDYDHLSIISEDRVQRIYRRIGYKERRPINSELLARIGNKLDCDYLFLAKIERTEFGTSFQLNIHLYEMPSYRPLNQINLFGNSVEMVEEDVRGFIIRQVGNHLIEDHTESEAVDASSQSHTFPSSLLFFMSQNENEENFQFRRLIFWILRGQFENYSQWESYNP